MSSSSMRERLLCKVGLAFDMPPELDAVKNQQNLSRDHDAVT